LRRRLDLELVRRGLATSRTEAQRAIAAGLVTVGGAPASNAARMVDAGDPVLLLAPPLRFVSRGGDKLDAALDEFDIDVIGLFALDAGASTGGFTDCLLQRGARRVAAVDVGHGQLHPKVRDDERVLVLEHTNVRSLRADEIGGPVDLVVADLSFISLRTVAPALVGCARPGAPMVMLVKPQFEAGRQEVSKGKGVVSDPEVWQRVRDEVSGAFSSLGAAIMGWMESPVRGAQGNVEFLLHVQTAEAAGTARGMVSS
jgi:23S rRNA (cytidine1920-2'-O)/16S rRNA (cytidine1409-2'-O)-methyltransferase